jgi:hypothetical protein
MPQETPNPPIVINAEVVSNDYIEKLRLLSQIHCEIAAQLNAKRETKLTAYHCEDDKYIPADPHEDLISIMQAVNACPS